MDHVAGGPCVRDGDDEDADADYVKDDDKDVFFPSHLWPAHCTFKVLDIEQPYPKAPPVPNERRGSMKRALQKVHKAERFLF